MFTLYAKLEGHELTWERTPALAKGSVEVDQIHFTFDDSWNGYSKVALFWATDASDPLGININGTGYATIPQEVLADKGRIKIGVYGKPIGSDTPRMTSTLLGYSVEQGAWSENIGNSGNPTASMIEQFQTDAYLAIDEARELLADIQKKGSIYFQELVRGKNLFNAYSEQNVDGSYLSANGSVSTGSGYSGLSHYIAVTAGKTYYIETGTTESSIRNAVFYDEFMEPIPVADPDHVSNPQPGWNAQKYPKVTAPTGAVAMRFTYRILTRYTDVQVEEIPASANEGTKHAPYISNTNEYDMIKETMYAHEDANDIYGMPNLFNKYSLDNISGYYLNGGVVTTNSNYGISHYIPVVEDRYYLVECGKTIASNGRTNRNVSRWAFYDEYGQMIFGGSGYGVKAPEDAVYMRVSYLLSVADQVIVEEYAPQGENLFNDRSLLNEDNVLVRWNKSGDSPNYSYGTLHNRNDSWGSSYFIPVTPGATYRFCVTGTSTTARIVLYDENFTLIPRPEGSANGVTEIWDDTQGHRVVGYWWQFTIPNDVYWIRIPYAHANKSSKAELVKSSTAPTAFSPYRGATIGLGDPCMAYLPDKIYCAVGRTIDIYNAQVVLNPERYYIRWVSDVGNPYSRKFSITGAAGIIGSHPLTLHVYDKFWREVYSKTATIVVAADMGSTKSMVMIGDSLTKHNKPVIAELMNLSASGGSPRITSLGTVNRANSPNTHDPAQTSTSDASGISRTYVTEARSGWSPLEYLTISGIDQGTSPNTYRDSEHTNAFFNTGVGFDWSYYKTQTGNNPNFVCVFLGTNGLAENPARQASYILELVNRIHTADSNLKILVCHPIYRSNQNGIGRQMTISVDGYTSGTKGPIKRIEDEKIMGLMIELDKALHGIPNVYTVPVAVSMDAEYNFGFDPVPVNPRNSDYVEHYPIDSIHPQASGYYQIADVIYSAICALI